MLDAEHFEYENIFICTSRVYGFVCTGYNNQSIANIIIKSGLKMYALSHVLSLQPGDVYIWEEMEKLSHI